MKNSRRTVWLLASGLVAASLLWLGTLTPDRLAPLISAQFSDVGWVERDQLALWREGGPDGAPVLLDARQPDEYAVSHLPGAIRIDPERPDLDVIDFAADRPVVVYCSVGYRSASVARKLQAAGANDVYNLRGGIFAWANEARPLVADGSPTQAVHPYGGWWGRLLRPEIRARMAP